MIDSYFFSVAADDDLSLAMNDLSASLICFSSAGSGRGMVTSGGTGAGGPIRTGGGAPRPAVGWAIAAPAVNAMMMKAATTGRNDLLNMVRSCRRLSYSML